MAARSSGGKKHRKKRGPSWQQRFRAEGFGRFGRSFYAKEPTREGLRVEAYVISPQKLPTKVNETRVVDVGDGQKFSMTYKGKRAPPPSLGRRYAKGVKLHFFLVKRL